MKYNLKINLLAIFGAVLFLLIVLPYKLSFTPDSMTYLEVANNLIAGKGIVNNDGYLVNHWPPLYPMAVGFISLIVNVGVIQGGFLLQILLFYLFLLSGMLIFRELKINEKLIPFFFFCFLFSQASINFLNFLSEGLFLVFLMFSFYFFIKWMHTKRLLYLVISALICSLVFLTRYAGIAFVSCYLLYIIFFYRIEFNKKIKNAIIFGSVFVSGILPWFIYQKFYDKPPVGRRIAIHIIPFSKIKDFFITIGYWFLGSTLAMILFLIIFIIFFFKRKTVWKGVLKLYKENFKEMHLILIFLFIYPLFLVISISVFDAWTPMDNRILSPLLGFVIILLFLLCQKFYEREKWTVLFTGLAFLTLSFSSSIFSVAKRHYENGGGYSKRMWVNSQTIFFLKNNSTEKTVFTNGVELGKLHLQKDFQLLPRKKDSVAINELDKKILNKEAIVVYFKDVNWNNYLISSPELKEVLNRNNIIEFEDGFIIE